MQCDWREIRRTPAAAVDHSPSSVSAYPYCDCFHNTAAVGFPVAGPDVNMQAALAVLSMLARFASGDTCRYCLPAADSAGGDVIACVL